MGLFKSKSPDEQLAEEMDQYGDGPQDRHSRLMRARTQQCQYHPRNGGHGRKPGDPRHFGDAIEDVLGPRT